MRSALQRHLGFEVRLVRHTSPTALPSAVAVQNSLAGLCLPTTVALSHRAPCPRTPAPAAGHADHTARLSGAAIGPCPKEQLLQLADGVLGARHGVAHDPGVHKDLVVVAALRMGGWGGGGGGRRVSCLSLVQPGSAVK